MTLLDPNLFLNSPNPWPMAPARSASEPEPLALDLILKGARSLNLPALERLLWWGLSQDLSDLVLVPGQPPWLRRHGVFKAVGGRAISGEETQELLKDMTSNEAAAAIVGSGQDLDFGFEIGERDRKKRFRGNATAMTYGRATGIAIALRAIPGRPPALSDLNLEPELIKNLFPADGLVLVTGVMGSGKSTLLAATLRNLAETYGRHVATYEEPVEFDLTDPRDLKGPVEQTEIPTHLPSFRLAPRNAARRAADVVFLGESRDREALKSLIEAAGLGVTAYTTAHTRGVAETPLRLINLFEPRERPAMAAELLSALRLIVQQRLYPKVGGGRVAAREFLALNAKDRRELQRTPLPELEGALTQMLLTKGQTLMDRVKALSDQGLIAREIADSLARERGVRL